MLVFIMGTSELRDIVKVILKSVTYVVCTTWQLLPNASLYYGYYLFAKYSLINTKISKVCSLHNVAIATECQCLLWLLSIFEIRLN